MNEQRRTRILSGLFVIIILIALGLDIKDYVTTLNDATKAWHEKALSMIPVIAIFLAYGKRILFGRFQRGLYFCLALLLILVLMIVSAIGLENGATANKIETILLAGSLFSFAVYLINELAQNTTLTREQEIQRFARTRRTVRIFEQAEQKVKRTINNLFRKFNNIGIRLITRLFHPKN